jgi:microcystin-dependent protein
MRFLFNPITSQFNSAPPREIIYSETAPAFPVEGTRWVNTLEIREYVFTFDANGAGYWVEVGIGSTGPEGPEGPKGDDGDVGPEGPEGPVGPAATIAVGTVTTGEPGTSVSVSNSGTSGAAVLDFTIPRGAVGEPGEIGPEGPEGPEGPRGLDGASVVLKGAVNLFTNLPTTGNTQGDLYVVQNDGNGYVWDGSDWVNVGQIRGPKGDTGSQGPAGPAPAGTGAVVVSNGTLGTPVGYGTANTANTLVQRDASGNFSAGTITANVTGNVTGSVTGGVSGNAGTATKLATARLINVSGDVTGTAQSFDGSANITIPTAITAGSIVNADINAAAAISDTKLATISTAGKVSNSATTATSANTANAIVARDTNGNFSANQITANLTGNVTGNATNVSGTVAIANGGTGSTTAAGALTNLGAAAATHSHNASAINAGTLDNARLPARLQAAAQTITDWDNALENGWFQGNQAANAPENVLTWWLGYVEAHYDRWVTQTVHRFTADAPTNTHIWRRSSSDSAGTRVWGAWYKLQVSQTEQDARYSLGTHTHGNITNAGAIGTTATLPIITGTNGVLQAGAFGTVAGSFCQGNDARLADARTPSSHTHGNITNVGAIGTTATLPIITGTNGVLQAGAFGTVAGTFAAGNHTHGNITNVGAIGTTASLPIITGTNGVLQAGAFGTAAGSFCQGNDARLADARTPSSHAHGNITNAGAIGTTASLPIITGTNGVLQAGAFGTVAGSFCQGNDPRLTAGTVPTGAVMPFAMNSVPTGWLAANGTTVNREVYATLFAAIGTIHGAGDGFSTFNLPDLQGIFVRGSGVQTVEGFTYNGGNGGTVGAKQNDSYPEHNHEHTDYYERASGTTVDKTRTDGGANRVTSVSSTGYYISPNSTTGGARSLVWNGAAWVLRAPNNTSQESRPANISLLYCIKF